MYTITFTDQYGNTMTYHAVTREQAEQIASEYASQYKGYKVSITGSPELAQVEQAVSAESEIVETPSSTRSIKNVPRKYTGPDKVLYINPKQIPNRPVGASFGPVSGGIQSLVRHNPGNYYVVLYSPTKTAWGKHVIAAGFQGNAKWYNPYMDALIAARRMAGWTGWGWKEYLITPDNKVIQIIFTRKPPKTAKDYVNTVKELKKVLPPYTPRAPNITNRAFIEHERFIEHEGAIQSNRTYKVVFTDENGSSVYNALTLQEAEEIAANLRKEYPGNHVYIVKPKGEVDRVVFSDSNQKTVVNQQKSTSVTHKTAKDKSKPDKETQNLDLDGALHRAAIDSENAQLAAYTQKLLEGKNTQEIQKALQEHGAQVEVKTLTFKESPEAAMYRQIEKEEKAREAAEEAQNAVDEIMTSTSPSYAILSGMNRIGKGIESKAEQLNEAAMKNSNPVVSYAEAVGAALLGAAAGVAELPEQTAEFVASAVKHPVKTVKSLLLAPATAVEDAVKDVESGNVVDYGKIVGQTFAAGEVADELGITPSRAIEKLPYTEKVLAPAKEFAERATAKLNDVIVRPLTEYKPVMTAVIVDTGEEKPIVTVSESPESASLGAIKDVGRIKEIKPVSAVVAETVFNLKTEPVEDIAEFKNPVEEGIAKVRGEEAEGTSFAKTRLKTGYEIQTEKPVRSVKIVTEYANRLGRKAAIASEMGEDTIKMLLRKGDEVKGYGVKVVDTYPLWDQESFGGLRVFGEAREAIPEETVKTIDLRDEETTTPIETIDLREMDENVRKAVGEDRSRNTGEQTYELKEETSRFKFVDVSEEMKALESELNDEIELPDLSKAFEKAVDFGKEALDIGIGLGVAGLNAGLNSMGELERTHARNSINDLIFNGIVGRQKGRVDESSKSRPDTSPDISPATSAKPSTSVTPSTTPAVTPATAVITYINPEPETNAKSKTKKPEQPELPFYIPPTGGEDFYRIIEEEEGRFGMAIKVNPVIDNPLSALFGGSGKGRKSRRKKR